MQTFRLKKVLIISPHYPPSNLAGVHRSRLFAQHLPSFGWQPIILTVHEKYYEEALDWNLHRLLPAGQRVEKVNAFKVTKPRFVGDIGLRAFFQLRKKAFELIRKEQIDFVYIPIPSYYSSLIGRYLQWKTGVQYGIDYIDPWVHCFPGSEKIFSRHWWSAKISELLEPIAVKNAAMITGVAEGYFRSVQERNPHLLSNCVFEAMPYGGEEQDHRKLQEWNGQPYLFQKKGYKTLFVYAGAMLPKAYKPLEAAFRSMAANRNSFKNVEIHFIGTGSRANDANSFTVKPLAEHFGLYGEIVFEYPKRIPYLDVLLHLTVADGIFILGSTEPHYTPSKVYQAVLSEKLILAVLHKQSTAVDILNRSGAGVVLAFDGEEDMQSIEQRFCDVVKTWTEKAKHFRASDVNREVLEQYSASAVTQKLAAALDQAVGQKLQKR